MKKKNEKEDDEFKRKLEIVIEIISITIMSAIEII